MIENGSRSEGIPGVFQATRVVLYAKAALTGVMGSAPFGYSNAKSHNNSLNISCYRMLTLGESLYGAVRQNKGNISFTEEGIGDRVPLNNPFCGNKSVYTSKIRLK